MKEKTHVYELLKNNIRDVDWQRIENVAGTGVPDANGCCQGIEFWSESKISTNGQYKLRPDQSAWLTRRYNCGGRVFITSREGDCLSIFRPDGRGKFIKIFETCKPFDYAGIRNIFLYSDIK